MSFLTKEARAQGRARDAAISAIESEILSIHERLKPVALEIGVVSRALMQELRDTIKF